MKKLSIFIIEITLGICILTSCRPKDYHCDCELILQNDSSFTSTLHIVKPENRKKTKAECNNYGEEIKATYNPKSIECTLTIGKWY
jgi:hypothetical protein